MDYFPEQDYDPDSGEYNSDFDFDPVFSHRVNLSDDIHAEVIPEEPDFDPLAEDFADRLQELVNHGYFDIEGNRNPLEYNSLSSSDFDTQSGSSRGPFIDADAVERWLDETGLRDQVSVYYDEDNDLYWIDADTSNQSGS
jgi:hypothetical protein